jgi:uncharacterized protein YjbK
MKDIKLKNYSISIEQLDEDQAMDQIQNEDTTDMTLQDFLIRLNEVEHEIEAKKGLQVLDQS